MKPELSSIVTIAAAVLLCAAPGCDMTHPHGISSNIKRVKVGMRPDEVRGVIEGWDRPSSRTTLDHRGIGGKLHSSDDKPKWDYLVSGVQEFGDDGNELPFNGTMTWLGKPEHYEGGKGLTVTFVDGKATETKWHQLKSAQPDKDGA